MTHTLSRLYKKGVPTSTESHSQTGFTLLELVIVVALIGLLLVLAVPSIQVGVFNDPLQKSCRKIIALLHETRDRAIREQQPYIIFTDLDRNRLWYIKDPKGSVETAEVSEDIVLELESGVEFYGIWVKSKGEVSRGIQELWVTKQGYMDQSILRLEDDDGVSMSLAVSTFISQVELHEGIYEPPEEQ